MKTLALIFVLASASAAAAAQPPRTVTLHVKDADVRDILRSMQKQCGIRNLVIDKDVSGEGSLFFRDVPCATAFRVVMRQFGLAGQTYSAVTTVETRKR